MLDFNPAMTPVQGSGISGLQQSPQDNNRLLKETDKCATAGIAVAGCAVAGWYRCACYEDTWDTVAGDIYSIDHDEC